MSTKTASYRSLGNTSKSRQQILDALELQPMTRYQLAQWTGMRVSSVCGRVNELVKLQAVKVSGRTTDVFTGKEVELLSLEVR